jgi:hypothetical protein
MPPFQPPDPCAGAVPDDAVDAGAAADVGPRLRLRGAVRGRVAGAGEQVLCTQFKQSHGPCLTFCLRSPKVQSGCASPGDVLPCVNSIARMHEHSRGWPVLRACTAPQGLVAQSILGTTCQVTIHSRSANSPRTLVKVCTCQPLNLCTVLDCRIVLPEVGSCRLLKKPLRAALERDAGNAAGQARRRKHPNVAAADDARPVQSAAQPGAQL